MPFLVAGSWVAKIGLMIGVTDDAVVYLSCNAYSITIYILRRGNLRSYGARGYIFRQKSGGDVQLPGPNGA